MSTLNSGHLAARILALRTHTGPRVALRRGGSVATEHYAYPYLAPLWAGTGWARTPILRVASLAATAFDIADDPDVQLGQLLRRIALTDVPAGAPFETTRRSLARIGDRLVWAQIGDVDKLHLILRQRMLRTGLTEPAVSWRQVVETYLWWDQPNAERRRVHRRRLLETFYTPISDGGVDSVTPEAATTTANK